MKKIYQHPAMQEEEMDMTSQLLAGTNIGEGGEGQQGDVKGMGSQKSSEDGRVFNVWDQDWSK